MNAFVPNVSPARRTHLRASVLGLGLGLACALAASSPALAPHAQAGIIGGAGTVERAALAYSQALQGAQVVVTGTGSVSVTPDVARLTLSTRAQDKSASSAAQAASDAAGNVRDALAAAGVAPDDLQTTGVEVYPRYAYSDAGEASVSGYDASVSFKVSGVAVADVADIVATALDAGATQVDELAYYASTYDEAYSEALAKAAAQAKAKAQALRAAQFGTSDDATLVLEKLEEGPASQAYRYASASSLDAMANEASGAAKTDVSASVNPGTIEIEASVTATYRAWDEQALGSAINEQGETVEVRGSETSGSASADAR